MISIWSKLSNLGIKKDMSITLQRLITLSNQISIALFPLLAIDIIRVLTTAREELWKAYLIMPLLILTGTVPYVNSRGKHQTGRLLVAVGIPLYIFLFPNIGFKLLLDSNIPLADFIKPGYALAVLIILPLSILDQYYDKHLYYIATGFVALLTILYDPVSNYLGIGIAESITAWPRYGILQSHRILLLLVIIFIFSAVKTTNHLYSQRLNEQQREIMTQNEELLQTKEEITAQRDFIEQKHQELEVKTNKIQDSILAAETIQYAMLPEKQQLQNYLRDYLLIYRPKDIVSGDFYWIKKRKNYLWIAIADCTGHGVPGAFMTIMGNHLLEGIVGVGHVPSPSVALQLLDREVKQRLRHKSVRNNSGMDLALIRMAITNEDTDRIEVTYAGAKTPLIISKHNQPLQVIHGDRRSIGNRYLQYPDFTDHQLQLTKGDTLYSFSDGIKDQNNKNRKKYGTRRLLKMLETHSHLPLSQQQQLLEQDFDLFAENEAQRDDILLFGFKV